MRLLRRIVRRVLTKFRAVREVRGWERDAVPFDPARPHHSPAEDREAAGRLVNALERIPQAFRVDLGGNPGGVVLGSLEPDFPNLVASTLAQIEELGLVPARETKWGYRIEPGLAERLSKRKVARLAVLDGAGRRLLRVRLERWQESEQEVKAPCFNPVSTTAQKEWFAERVLSGPRPGRVAELVDGPLTTDPDFDVDVVYTWVNDQDPKWRALYEEHRGDRPPRDGTSLARFMNRDELLYSVRSVDEFAPWVRNIYVLTNCAPPSWVNLDHPRLRWIDHEQVFPEGTLPTFNSHAIESRLHHIPGLANQFLYLNDDFMFSRPVSKTDFFSSAGHCLPKLERWGRVNGTVCPTDPDYLNAARLGQRLLFEKYGRSATRLHQHTCYALRVDLLCELEELFPEEFARTSRSTFRSVTDISIASFLFHHYALIRREAIHRSGNVALIQARNRYRTRFEQILARRSLGSSPLTICINDGAGSDNDRDWNHAVVDFLKAMYPRKSQFER